MSWQDIAISVANVVFSISLIIQVYYGFKEKNGPIKFQASFPTAVGLFAISFAYWTLNLRFSTVVAFLNGTLWSLLFVQKIIYKNNQ